MRCPRSRGRSQRNPKLFDHGGDNMLKNHPPLARLLTGTRLRQHRHSAEHGPRWKPTASLLRASVRIGHDPHGVAADLCRSRGIGAGTAPGVITLTVSAVADESVPQRELA